MRYQAALRPDFWILLELTQDFPEPFFDELDRAGMLTCFFFWHILLRFGFSLDHIESKPFPDAFYGIPLLIEKPLDLKQQFDVFLDIDPLSGTVLRGFRKVNSVSQYRSTYGSTPTILLTSPIL